MSIREKGEGSLYFEKSRGLWTYEVTYSDANGKSRRKKFRGKTKAIAKSKSENFLNPETTLGYLKDLKSWLVYWLENMKHNSVAGKTFEKYQSNLVQYIIPYFGAKKVEDLSYEEIQRHFFWLQNNGGRAGKGISPSTIRSARRTLIQAIDDGIKMGFFRRNIVKMTNAPKITKEKIIVLSPQEENAMMTAAKKLDDEYYSKMLPELLQLTLRTGMRRGEVFGLLWQDIDFDGCYITIRRQLTEEVGKGLVLREPKTQTSCRRISIDISDVKALAAYKKWQQEYFDGIPGAEKFNDFVFRSAMGTPLRTSNFLRRHFHKLIESCGIDEHFRFHDLRHTHATRLLQKNINPKVVQERLGHSSIKVTMDTYSHVLPDMQQTAVAALGERI